MLDYIAAVMRKGVVTLTGSVTPDRNKAEDIVNAVARVPGVQDIQNQIVTLPTSQGDDGCPCEYSAGQRQHEARSEEDSVQLPRSAGEDQHDGEGDCR